MIYVFLANGFEEVEALMPVDILRRCELPVLTVGIGDRFIQGSHKITTVCDASDSEISISDVAAIILPGGMPGTLNLEKSKVVNEFIDYANENNILICAICAAPSILGHKNILNGKTATCFPGFEKELIGATLSDEYICQDGNIITARGMGVAEEFALKIAENLVGKEKAEKIKNSIGSL
ncbi:MAG: DJ-1/PfpI family protein [Oscillospiraceae bacterium]